MKAIFHFCIYASAILLSISAILTFIRVLIGPSLPDRVAAFDVMAILVACLITIFSVSTKHSIYLDIVIALALVSFLGTLAFAQFIEFQLSHSDEEDTSDD